MSPAVVVRLLSLAAAALLAGLVALAVVERREAEGFRSRRRAPWRRWWLVRRARGTEGPPATRSGRPAVSL